MNALEDFEQFFREELLPAMPQLKAKAVSARVVGFVALGLAVVLVILWFSNWLHPSGLLIFLLIMGVIVALYFYQNSRENFIYQYKEAVVQKVINHLVPGAVYKPQISISQKEYKASGLFRHYYDDFSGDDFISGIYNNVSFRCGDLDVSRKRSSRIFKGFFFNAKISSTIRGGTYIWDRDFVQLPDSLLEEAYRMMPLPRVWKVPVTNADFNKCFKVYSSYPAEASVILTPGLITQMVNLRQKLHTGVTFSFVAGHCYVAISTDADLLEPGGANAEDKARALRCYMVVSLIPELINTLALYEKI
jgi:hypothetical protein